MTAAQDKGLRMLNHSFLSAALPCAAGVDIDL
jgi:hypothetical protein